MRGYHRSALAALIVPISLWLCIASASAIGIALLPTKGHPKIGVKVTGSGFGANEAVDIYFDTTDVRLTVTDASGNFQSSGVKVPASAEPGLHWFTAIGRHTGEASQAKFIVQTDWLEFGWNEHGKRNNLYENVVDASNADRLETAWSQFLSDPILATPASANGSVYIGSTVEFVALDENKGVVKWFGCGQIVTSPAVAKNTVYGTGFGFVYACNATTGALMWQFQAGLSFNVSSPVVSNGTVYFGTDEGNLYALNAVTGAVVWTAALGGTVSTPAVAGGTVYAGSSNGNVWAVDAMFGGFVWNRPTSGAIVAAPAVSDGRVYIGSSDGKLYAIGTEFGDIRWTAMTGGPVAASAAIAGNSVYVGSDDGKVYDLNKSNGATIWSAPIGAHVRSSPAVANGVVYATSDDNTVYALDASNGTSLWSAVGGGGFSGLASPIITDGVLLVGSSDSYMYGYALDAGNNAANRRNKLPPPFASLHPNLHLSVVR